MDESYGLNARKTIAALTIALTLMITLSLWALGDESTLAPPESLEAVAGSNETSDRANRARQFPQTWQLGPHATFRLRGRFDADSIWTIQSSTNEATFGDLGDVVGIRRAWIGGEGELGSNGRYVAEVDIASGEVVPRDVFAGIGDVEMHGEYRGGHFLEPFSLELGTNSNVFAFMELSPVNMLDPARNWGAGLFRAAVNENSALAIGLFHAGTDTSDFQSGEGSTAGVTGRLTAAPINRGEGDQLLHFGLALSERVPEDGVIIINQQPLNPLLNLGDTTTSPFVPTIRIPATFQQLVNLQFAAANGPTWIQSEWYGSVIDQTGGEIVFLHGGYIACGYFMTGEHRTYQSANGVFGPIRVEHPVLRSARSTDRTQGWGAWELTARLAYLDFVDADTPAGPLGQQVGIQLPTATCGVNWYLADRVRLLFNYNYEFPEEPNTGASVAHIFGARLNIYW